MRLAVLADIHGNVLALHAVRADLTRRKVDAVVNLGDCVSGPLWPRETIEALLEANWPTVRGNHDRWVAETPTDKLYPSDAFAHGRLDAAQRAWLGALPPTLDLGHGVFACHGRPRDDNAYLVEDIEDGRLVRGSAETIANRLGDFAGPIILCAHSHLPHAVKLPDGRWVINPGSVGCPAYDDPTPPAPHVSESGSPLARYAVLELEGDRVGVDLIGVSYDHAAAARCAEENGRPAWAHALLTGTMPQST